MNRILTNTPNWVTITDANVPAGTKYWHLRQVEYLDDSKSGGTHHIYAGEPHDPSVRMEISNGEETWFVPLDKPHNEPAGNFPMWYPNRYSAKIEGLSDRIDGMQMPQKQHVSFRLTWERREKGGTQGDLGSLENILLKKAQEASFDLNQNSALFKDMQTKGYLPVSPEFTVEYKGETWIGQTGKNLENNETQIFYVLNGNWDHVQTMKKKQ